MKKFSEESIFITPKWDKSWSEGEKHFMSGTYNVPNGWRFDDYDAARAKIAAAIVAMDRKLAGGK